MEIMQQKASSSYLLNEDIFYCHLKEWPNCVSSHLGVITEQSWQDLFLLFFFFFFSHDLISVSFFRCHSLPGCWQSLQNLTSASIRPEALLMCVIPWERGSGLLPCHRHIWPININLLLIPLFSLFICWTSVFSLLCLKQQISSLILLLDKQLTIDFVPGFLSTISLTTTNTIYYTTNIQKCSKRNNDSRVLPGFTCQQKLGSDVLSCTRTATVLSLRTSQPYEGSRRNNLY